MADEFDALRAAEAAAAAERRRAQQLAVIALRRALEREPARTAQQLAAELRLTKAVVNAALSAAPDTFEHAPPPAQQLPPTWRVVDGAPLLFLMPDGSSATLRGPSAAAMLALLAPLAPLAPLGAPPPVHPL